MKITFIITYLKKTDSISFDLNKKIIKVEEEEESFKGDGTISTIDKQMKKIAIVMCTIALAAFSFVSLH